MFSCKKKDSESGERKKKSSHLMSGLILGGIIGSVAALLLAPEKGEKTREKVFKKTGKFIEDHPELNKNLIRKSKKHAKSVLGSISKKLSDLSKKM